MTKTQAQLSDTHIKTIQESNLFNKIPEETIKEFLEFATTQSYVAGENIVTQGDNSRSFFIILEGQVGVYKHDDITDEEYLFTTLGVGDEFGELSLIVEQERAATVRADDDVLTLELSPDLAKTQQPMKFMLTYSTLMKNIARELARKLIVTDDFAIQNLKTKLALAQKQNAMAEFIVFIIGIMSLFSFSLAIISSFSEDIALVDTFSNVATGLAVFAFLIFIQRSPYAFEEFGLRVPERLIRHIFFALLWSGGLIIITILAKWVVIEIMPAFDNFPLFFIPGQDYEGLEYAASKLNVSLTLGYIILALIQEIMTRGVIQSVLTDFFSDWSYKHFIAILLSNTLFAVAHLHISPTFAIITFVTGCMWGIQYVYQPSIIGVWISHTIVGLFGLRILGLVTMIRIIEL